MRSHQACLAGGGEECDKVCWWAQGIPGVWQTEEIPQSLMSFYKLTACAEVSHAARIAPREPPSLMMAKNFAKTLATRVKTMQTCAGAVVYAKALALPHLKLAGKFAQAVVVA